MNEDLLKWRAEFPALDACTHLISHSLGCMPAKARTYMKEYLDLWEKRSITSWDVWLPEVEATGNRIARILSAPEGTVAMRHNVSEIQAVMASCFDYSPKRNKVVYSSLQFPTVSYVWKAEERRSAQCYIVESDDGITVDTQKMCDAIDERTVVVPISHVLFSSAYIQDAKSIQKAKSVGAHVILDCYQSTGTIPVDVVDLGVSFACGGSCEVPVRRGGRRVPLRPQGSDREPSSACHQMVRQRIALRVYDAGADIHRQHLAVHRRHAGGCGALSSACRPRDHRRDRRHSHP